jgi:hypothetical protein
VLLALEIGAGCAWFRGEEPVPPAFQQIAVRTQVDMTDDGELEGDLHGDTAVKGAAIGLGPGTVTGGGIGFAWGTVACTPTTAAGPFAVIFYPACVAFFAVAGAVIGGTTGAVTGGSTGLPWKP